jgi:hypothetical protein
LIRISHFGRENTTPHPPGAYNREESNNVALQTVSRCRYVMEPVLKAMESSRVPGVELEDEKRAGTGSSLHFTTHNHDLSKDMR